MSWSIDPAAVAGLLGLAEGYYDELVTQFSGGPGGGGAATGSSQWQSQVEVIEESDVVVANAFVAFVEAQLESAGVCASGFARVVQATQDAAVALVAGDEAMAAQIVASEAAVR